MADKKWIDINGSIEADVNEAEFTVALAEWLESKGWSFFGLTKENEEGFKDEMYESDIVIRNGSKK